MVRGAPLAIAVLIAFTAPLAAQGSPAVQQPPAAPAAPAPPVDPSEVVTEPPVPDPQGTDTAAAPAAPARTSMVGTWEFSNADREKTCTITFQENTQGTRKVQFGHGCSDNFPFVAEIAGWSQADNDFLRLLDAKGKSVLEFSEVESGIFEAPRAGEGILFIQNPAGLGAPPKTADQITGDWRMVLRTGKALCTLALSNTAIGEEFAVRVQPPCDAVVARFAPVTWQMDRGEIVLRSANGQSWRFEEGDDSKWRRIPETTNPILLVRK